MHYEKNYIEKNLLAYIGNKRKLIPLIVKAIEEISKRGNVKIDPQGWFLDLFSGTGVVSRLAKSLGFKTIANDWEEYSYIFNKGFLENSVQDLSLFESEGGLENVLKRLNELTHYNAKESYLSDFYCPQSDAQADPNQERMFYTRENGIIIDNIRSKIDEMYPEPTDPQERYSKDYLIKQKKKNFLLALLLKEASKRSNTSGVFKGFHHGFGGKKQNALSRILGTVKLEAPKLSEQQQLCKVYKEDAIKLVEKVNSQKAEITYLDPPYNQHQYGSNYHLLNTIALNDKPTVKKEFMINGKKKDKSAIRKDWVKTKSALCYQKTAKRYFRELVRKINSKYIMVSYSTEGIIPFDEMLEILSSKGKLAVVTSSYIRYRGGRQANSTQKSNLEFIIIVDTSLKNTAADIENIKSLFHFDKTRVILEDFFPINKISKVNSSGSSLFENKINLKIGEKGVSIYLEEFKLSFELDKQLKLKADLLEKINKFSYQDQNIILSKLKGFYSDLNHEKVENILNILKDDRIGNFIDNNFFHNELFRLYNKTSYDLAVNQSLKGKILKSLEKPLSNTSLSKNIEKKYERLAS